MYLLELVVFLSELNIAMHLSLWLHTEIESDHRLHKYLIGRLTWLWGKEFANSGVELSNSDCLKYREWNISEQTMNYEPILA